MNTVFRTIKLKITGQIMKRFSKSVLALVLIFLSPDSRAQDSLGIAAVVNDKVISVYDLGMRLSLVTIFTGLPNNSETRNRLVPQVLQTLIEEQLKRQEASRRRITASDKAVKATLRNLEKDNKLGKGGLKDYLAKRGVEQKTIIDQIKTDQVWRRLVNVRYGSKVIITDEEIDEVMAEMKKNEDQPEYQVAEIFLPVENQEKESETVAQINQLLQQARAGSHFQALARNFSKNPSSKNGGDLGWNRLGQLGADYDNAMVRLKPGQISPPFRTADGYAILYLIKQRTAKALGSTEAYSAIVNLQQLFLPIPKGSSPSVVNDAMEGAKKIGEKAKNCTDLDKVGKETGSALSGNLGDIKTSALAAQQRSMIRGLPPLKASRPLRTADGVIVLMVCRRDEANSPELTVEDLRESIASRLRNERLSILARQYLREIRRTAFVEVRL